MKNKKIILTLIKYGISFLLLGYSIVTTGAEMFAFVGFFELVTIILIINIIAGRSEIAATVTGSIVLFVFNLEMMILCLSGGEYLKLIMLTNVDSIEALSGDFRRYIIGAVILVAAAVLPVTHLDLGRLPWRKTERRDTAFDYKALSGTLLCYLLVVMLVGNTYSPLFSLKLLHDEYQSQQKLAVDISGMPDKTGEFLREDIESYTDLRPLDMDQPNVVVIFAEGVSQNIIEEERDIMPNARKLEEKSINFENYYNHTAPTYRGIISQLYSGYQKENLDTNTLISMQSILKDTGYNTAFINTEPRNSVFTSYLRTLGFDEIVSTEKLDGKSLKSSYETDSKGKTVSDKQAFELLMTQMEEMNKDKAPFFIGIYTFGTHNSLDSTDEKFGDGSDRVLNKFYNLDCQLGSFLNEFDKSSLADNTIVIFTTDHCAYNSEDFRRAFPDHKRSAAFLDRIPLAVYYKGVEHQDINAAGKNSLDFAPTVMDLMGISEKNYFLGSSLFNEQEIWDSIENEYYDGSRYLTSAGNEIGELDLQRREIFEKILSDYLIAKQQEPQGN